MAKEKIITTHGARVKRAKDYIADLPVKVSLIDREAFVEFYLLEDIVRLYEYRLDREMKKQVTTRAGEIAKRSNIEKFSAIVKIFTSAVEIAWAQIDSGNYKSVWKAIPEHALIVAANSLKYLPRLRELAGDMLRTLSSDALTATGETVALDEMLDEIEDHEANVREVKGLPSQDEIEAIIRAAEVAIPGGKKNKSSRINPNLN